MLNANTDSFSMSAPATPANFERNNAAHAAILAADFAASGISIIGVYGQQLVDAARAAGHLFVVGCSVNIGADLPFARCYEEIGR